MRYWALHCSNVIQPLRSYARARSSIHFPLPILWHDSSCCYNAFPRFGSFSLRCSIASLAEGINIPITNTRASISEGKISHNKNLAPEKQNKDKKGLTGVWASEEWNFLTAEDLSQLAVFQTPAFILSTSVHRSLGPRSGSAARVEATDWIGCCCAFALLRLEASRCGARTTHKNKRAFAATESVCLKTRSGSDVFRECGWSWSVAVGVAFASR